MSNKIRVAASERTIPTVASSSTTSSAQKESERPTGILAPLVALGPARRAVPHGQVGARRFVRKVAVADDDDDIASVYSSLIQAAGYHAEFIAHDGDEIVEAVVNGTIHPDAIIMDYNMPRMNGIEASREIREFDPSIRIAIVSGDESVREEANDLGLDFIQKPYSNAEFIDFVSNAGAPTASME
jgi:CheY-like chemotaxis protein